MAVGSGEAPLRERRPRYAAADVRHDVQLDGRDALQLNPIVLDLADSVRRAERVLLADDVAVRSPVIPRPPERELLRPRYSALLEHQTNTLEALRIVEAEAESLRTRLGGTPGLPVFETESGLDWIFRV